MMLSSSAEVSPLQYIAALDRVTRSSVIAIDFWSGRRRSQRLRDSDKSTVTHCATHYYTHR